MKNITKFILLDKRFFPLILIASLIISVIVSVTTVKHPKQIVTSMGALAGDCDGNGTVNILDFQLLSNSFGKSSGQSGFNAKCDFNSDTVINILDFQILSNNFGKSGVTPTPGKGITISVIEDSHVSSQNTSTNYGSSTTAIASDISSGNIRLALLKFNVSSVGSMQSAELRLTAALDRKVEKKVFKTTSSWEEATVNYTNKPSTGSQVGYLNRLSTTLQIGEVVSIPLIADKLTPDPNGNISLLIDNAGSGNTLQFYTKESGKSPQLVLNGGDSTIPTSTPTPSKTVTPTPKITLGPTPTIPQGGAYRAFTNNSYWNTPMPANAPIDPRSSIYIADSQNSSHTQNFLGFTAAPGNTQAYGLSVFWGKSTDPLHTLYDGKHFTSSNPVKIHIPIDAKPQSGNDGEVVVFDLSTDQVIEMSQASFDGTKWHIGKTLDRYMLSSNGLDSRVTGSNDSRNFGHRGVTPSSRGIRIDEVKAGAINHRLECYWWATGIQTVKHYWPMAGDEGAKGGIVPEGIVIRIKPSIDLTKKGLNSSALIIARALQTYGCLVGDNSGAGNRVKLEINESEWRNLGISFDSLKNIPWSDWEFIKGGYDPVTGTIKQ